jgi:phytoene dehydrogenase-like protein
MTTSSSAAASTRLSPRPCFRLKGKRVLVLERSDRFGGCMRTEEITLPGFHHDVMAATFVLFLTSPAHAALGSDLARHGFEFCHTPHPTAVLRPDGSSLVLTTDRAANIKNFNALSAGDGDRHGADVGAIEADAPFLFALLGGELWSWPTAKLMSSRPGSAASAVLPPGWARRFARSRAWLEAGYLRTGPGALCALGSAHRTDHRIRLWRPDGQGHRLRVRSRRGARGQGRRRPGRECLQALIEENGGELRSQCRC